MGFELGSLYSATVDVIIIGRRLSATPPSLVGPAVSNSVVYLAAERIHTPLEINNLRASLVWGFFAYEKILGRTETQTRDKMYLGRIRSVRHIPRRSSKNCDLQFKNCDLQFANVDRLKRQIIV